MNRLVPVRSAAEHHFVKISARGNQTCGVTSSGTIYCWGVTAGQLGAVSTEQCFDVFAYYDCSATPLKVNTDVRFTDVTAGGSHACGLTASGAAYCWGGQNVGELGHGLPQGSNHPVEVAGGHRFSRLVAGHGLTCGLTDGSVYCWGRNNYGEVGSETSDLCSFYGAHTPCASSPVRVTGGHSFDSISSDGSFTCGIASAGGVYCWGDNGSGKLGQADGEVLKSSTPLRVYGTR